MPEQTTIPEQRASQELVKSGVITEQQNAEIEKLPLLKSIRSFVIVNPDGSESGQYHGRTPRQAALKAIKALAYDILTRGEVSARHGTSKESAVTFKLRERTTKKLHIFRGYVEVVPAPEKRPAWMKAGTMMKVAHVEKIGIEKVD